MDHMIIKNIQKLVLTDTGDLPLAFLKGKQMSKLPCLDDAFLCIENGVISNFGAMSDCPHWDGRTIDAKGKHVLPAWCDSHTHLVFAGNRSEEFVDRIKGMSYEDIAKRGGGILNSAKRLQAASEEELLEQALKRLNEVMCYGTGAIEIKSGYGLTLESELKILRVVQRLKKLSPLTIKATFLGAHAIPSAFKQNRSAYIDLVIDKMIPQVAEEQLADYIDVFCEKVAFSVKETQKIIEAGAKYGLKAKIHTNQFNSMGGIELAVKHGAISVDHLETLNAEEIAILKTSDTIATLLPSAPFFINDQYPPAREMIDAGLGVALASDYNPGSSPSGKIPFVLSLACIKSRMLPEEAIAAATLNGAYAMELEDDLGSIRNGKRANLILTSQISSLGSIPYAFGTDCVDTVILDGKVVFSQHI